MRLLIPVLAAGLLGAAPAPSPYWSEAQIAQLVRWIAEAREEGLQVPSRDISGVSPEFEQPRDDAATAIATDLLTAYRQGCCNHSLRAGWHIDRGPAWSDARATIVQAVVQDRVDATFTAARPSHPFYQALSAAYARESDPAKRVTLAANLDRWRWMPRDLGKRYLLVNTAAFEATLWQDRRMVGRWAVIVGRTKSPTPVFQARVTGVTVNPWWEIPPSIAAEGIAAQVARNPAAAGQRGYIRQNGRYRQRPGPANALGRMKLVMPNPFHVYLHDTPAQALFAQDVRAYSHGCIRVGDALGLAATLLAPAWDRVRVDALVASGATRTIALAEPVPVYVAYFTAEPDEAGGIRYFPDVYHRDSSASAPQANGQCAK